MAPSAIHAPEVPESAYETNFDTTDAPPTEEVQNAIETEPEVQQLFSLSGGTVIITGAARGLGLTMAAAVLEANADVYCLDILEAPSQPEWKSLQAKAAKFGGIARYRQVDITDVEGVDRCFAGIAAQARYPVSGFVGSAATQHEQPAIDYDMQKFRKVMQINVDGAMITAQAAARLMRASGKGGSIVLIASMSGSIANRGLSCTAYNASKAACHQLCRSVSVEWAEYKIRVNTLSPGYIRTAMTNMLLQGKPELADRWENDNPLKRIAMPSEFKGPAIYLLSQASSFVTGSDLRVDGGHCAW